MSRHLSVPLPLGARYVGSYFRVDRYWTDLITIVGLHAWHGRRRSYDTSADWHRYALQRDVPTPRALPVLPVLPVPKEESWVSQVALGIGPGAFKTVW